MRKILFAATLLLTTLGLQAQNENLKHEIGITYGAGISTIGDGIGSAIGSGIADVMVGREWTNESRFGTIGLEYFYHLTNPKLAVGGIVTFAQYGEDIEKKSSHQIEGDRSRTYLTVMPAVKYSWVNKKHFAFYSKVAGGAMILMDRTKFSGKNDTDTSVRFMGQFSPLGIEVGSAFRVFLELGVGEQGIALAGLKYKF